MHEAVVSTWLNAGQMIIFVPTMYLMGESLKVIRQFNWVDWILVVGMGGLAVLS